MFFKKEYIKELLKQIATHVLIFVLACVAFVAILYLTGSFWFYYWHDE